MVVLALLVQLSIGAPVAAQPTPADNCNVEVLPQAVDEACEATLGATGGTFDCTEAVYSRGEYTFPACLTDAGYIIVTAAVAASCPTDPTVCFGMDAVRSVRLGYIIPDSVGQMAGTAYLPAIAPGLPSPMSPDLVDQLTEPAYSLLFPQPNRPIGNNNAAKIFWTSNNSVPSAQDMNHRRIGHVLRDGSSLDVEGTAFMVRDTVAMTAGHVMTDTDYVAYDPTDFVVRFGRAGSDRVFRCRVADAMIPTAYTWDPFVSNDGNYGNFRYDYAYLKFDCPDLGTTTGAFGASTNAIGAVSASGYWESGCPTPASGHSPDNEHQFYNGAMVVDVYDTTFWHDIDTCDGASGAPVWREDLDVTYGIHTGYVGAAVDVNRAVRWTTERITKIAVVNSTPPP